MNFSNETVEILKNFATINSGILFKKGNVIRTISTQKNILAEAKIAESFPNDFGIYDLGNFLQIVSTYNDAPKIDFNDSNVIITGLGNRSKTQYRYCAPGMVVVPPEKNISMPNPEVSFELSEGDLKWILNISSILSTPQIAIESDGEKIYVTNFDVKDDSTSQQSLDLCDGNGDIFKYILNTENIKVLPGSYSVEISTKGIAHFKNKTKELKYWITTEPGSSYTPK